MSRWGPWALLAALAAVLVGVVLAGRLGAPDRAQISYTQLTELVDQDAVAEVLIRGHAIRGRLKSPEQLGPQDVKTAKFQSRVPSFGADKVIAQLEEHGVKVHVEEARQGSGWSWLLFLLPLILIGMLYLGAARRMASRMGGGGGPGGMFGLSQTRAKRVQPETSRTRFDDVAGQDAAKRDVTELVEYLRDPERYRRLGAQAPHGILLAGPPGTGKTLMARALAGEAGVPFLHMSGSEFIEMVVGVGAARVRQTFEEAKKNQPAILFIDEIDAIGRQRGTGMGGGNDEREQTLNQILDEMDGFDERESVIVVAATNRPDVLDPALLRPGRFDRQLTLELPDREARKAILGIHTREVPLTEDVDIGVLAAATPGFSGAHLKNLVNEAAMLAARDGTDKVSWYYFDQARDKVMLGPERPLVVQPEERRRLAAHESGHTAAAHYLSNTDPPYRVSIVPRGQSLGGTHQLPEAERHTMDEPYLRDRLAVMLAGRACEKMLLGNVSSGADDDIRQATRMARAMVTRWGMSDAIGPIDLRESDDNPFLGLEMTRKQEHSDETAHAVDEEVQKLLREAERRAGDVLQRHRDRIEQLVRRLEQEETLQRDAIRECLGLAEESGDTAPRDGGRSATQSPSRPGRGAAEPTPPSPRSQSTDR